MMLHEKREETCPWLHHRWALTSFFTISRSLCRVASFTDDFSIFVLDWGSCFCVLSNSFLDSKIFFTSPPTAVKTNIYLPFKGEGPLPLYSDRKFIKGDPPIYTKTWKEMILPICNLANSCVLIVFFAFVHLLHYYSLYGVVELSPHYYSLYGVVEFAPWLTRRLLFGTKVGCLSCYHHWLFWDLNPRVTAHKTVTT